MADALIKNKNLMQRLNSVSRDDFVRAVQMAGLHVTKLTTGSHYAIRRPGFASDDIRGVVTTIYEDMSKQTKMKIIKRLVREGLPEDELWKNLGVL